MKNLISAALILATVSLAAASGQHIKRAVLTTRSGAPVASQEADSTGRVLFTGLKPGEYKLTLTNADGRSVVIGDLNGDGAQDIAIGDPGVNGMTTGVKAPRDLATGQASGKRMHKPFSVVVDWSGTVKGGFMSEMEAQAAGQRMAPSPAGACAVTVTCDAQPGTIEVRSSAVGRGGWDLATGKK